jgi:hypothetical protein
MGHGQQDVLRPHEGMTSGLGELRRLAQEFSNLAG